MKQNNNLKFLCPKDQFNSKYSIYKNNYNNNNEIGIRITWKVESEKSIIKGNLLT